MSKRHEQLEAEARHRLRAIEARWKSVDIARTWTSLPVQARERVLADLEEQSREAEPAEAGALQAAIYALDVLPNIVDQLAPGTAQEDIQVLLAMLTRDRREP